jgi:hypothetical protein
MGALAPLFGVNRVAIASVVVLWTLISVLVPSIFYFGYGAENWRERSADRAGCEACTCFANKGCFDGRFKGSFAPGGYKSVYFNLEPATAFILLDLLVYATLATETIKHVLALLVTDASQLWVNAAISLALLLYPNYYSFWCFFNYVNDRSWVFLDNQLFFAVTELVAAWMCVRLLDKRLPATDRTAACSLVSGIAVSHLALALLDQLRDGYFVFAPRSHQRLRDASLLVPELLVLAMLLRKPSLRTTAVIAAVLVPGALLLFAAAPLLRILT